MMEMAEGNEMLEQAGLRPRPRVQCPA